MREDFNFNVTDVVSKITLLGAKDLATLAGQALLTAEIGKIPSWSDMTWYMGCTKAELAARTQVAIRNSWDGGNGALARWYGGYYEPDKVSRDIPSRNAVLYSLAASLISSGLCAPVDIEPDDRKQARLFLQKYISPQMIQTKSQFRGYLMLLEFLEMKLRGTSNTVNQFLQSRFGAPSSMLNPIIYQMWLYNSDLRPFETGIIPKPDTVARRLYFELKRQALD